MRSRILCRFMLLGAVALITGCVTVGYYAQSVRGQWDILSRSQAISDVLDESDDDARLQDKLKLVLEVRKFATEALRLPDNGSYTRYADLGRPYAVWNVFAAPELSLVPQTWCFPVVGCVVYRGYFDREDARRFASSLQTRGLDVFVGGVPAYSTLGWFADPILNTVMGYADVDLAGLVFHELAHQLVYVKDDSVFNESFATAVELEGVRRWLQSKGDEARIAAYRERKRRDRAVVALILRHREDLARIYGSDRDAAWMRREKHAVIADMQRQFTALTASWPDYDRFRAWFSTPINNAKLVAVAAYQDLVPDFEALLDGLDGDLGRFYGEVERLAKLDKVARTKRLKRRLVSEAVPDPGRQLALSRRRSTACESAE